MVAIVEKASGKLPGGPCSHPARSMSPTDVELVCFAVLWDKRALRRRRSDGILLVSGWSC